MVLIGMPDSPYVRRVAVSMKLMGLPFEHRQVSVFRHYDRFRAINPVVKAPSFITDDGTVLMDSTLILDYLEALVPAGRRLMPPATARRLVALRLIGLAMAACEKCVQIVYEKQQRPADKRHEPWMERVTGQANAAFEELEVAVTGASPWFGGSAPDAADIAVACAWRFSQYYDAVEIPAPRYPNLVSYSRRAEALPEFLSTPLDERN
jgi:glutathione S-transferase